MILEKSYKIYVIFITQYYTTGLENDAHKIRLEILEEERKKVAEVEAKKQAEIQKYR